MAVQPGLCQTWSETMRTGFLPKRLNYIALVVQNKCYMHTDNVDLCSDCAVNDRRSRMRSPPAMLIQFDCMHIARAVSLRLNLFWGFLTRSNTNQAVRPQKRARGLKFRI